ncbi:MAG: ABC transporter ATP-binding protein [Rhodospirillaceae bacterium]|nr:ABC transporter ATP-binding protein [Rhodospirillaceae bacterium]
MTASVDRAHVVVSEVAKEFETGATEPFVALDNIDLTIDQGEFVLLLGPSGCGKSTLLRLIAGLDAPTRGDIRVSGDPIAAGFERIGMVFQQPTLLPWLSILENVVYPARVRSQRLAREKRGEALRLLDMVGLSRVADQPPSSLSGGMQQRAAICRSLILDPEILVMDEPFSALDAMTREELQFELLRIHADSGKTIIFVTHSIPEAVLMSSKIVVMATSPGRIAETLETGMPHPRTLETLRLDRARELDSRIRQLIYERDRGRE